MSAAAALTVSVVIPTCDRPQMLPRALASVAAQTLPPLEVLVVDDGSAAPVVGSGVRLLRNRGPRGPSAARNRGAAAARGTLLAFLDDDDEWLPDYLAAALAQIAAARLDVLCTDLVYRDAGGREWPGKAAPDALRAADFLTRNPGLIGSNVIVRASVYAAAGGFDERLRAAEDMDFGLRLSGRRGLRYAPLRRPLVRHHQHDQARLCTVRGEAMRSGIRRFFALHGGRMDADQRARFAAAVRALWGIDEYGRDQAWPR